MSQDTNRIAQYFQAKGQARALAAYSEFAGASAWSVQHKFDLYALSRSAFGGDGDLAAFKEIQNHLVRSWQIFRPHPAEQCWPAEKTFETLRNSLRDYRFGSPITLANVTAYEKYHDLLFSLLAFDELKPNQYFPVMAVSKFTHFFNPSLFPIYDTAVVQNKVFACFGDDYTEFCIDFGIDPSANEAAFLRNYILWAGSLVKSRSDDFMAVFAEWVKNELPPRFFATLKSDEILSLYAAAFEFTAIGAAVLEGF